MFAGFKKDFCLWVVPSNDGRVRKIRFTLKRALTIIFCLTIFIGGLFYIAGDYTRVQMIRAKTFLSLQLVKREKEGLKKTNTELNDKLGNLKAINQKVLNYERNVRERLDELSTVIETASSMGLIPPDKNSELKENKDDGIGGAEIDCGDGTRCSPFEEASYVASLTEQLDMKAVDDLTERLDHYLSLLRQVPLGSPANGHVSSPYGVRQSPFTGRRGRHEGIDFSMPTGSYVYSAAEGVVTKVRYDRTYGRLIDVKHSNNVVTRYAHLSKQLVKVGDEVCRGEVIGLVGSTGRSTGPHLHYEVRVNNRAINPLTLIHLARKLEKTF